MNDGVVHIEPLTADRWGDAVAVFGTRGDPARCWCQFFRLEPADWKASAPGQNRNRLLGEARRTPPPGLLAYLGGEPVGWLALGPRPGYARLRSSRLAQVAGQDLADDRVWAITCFVVRVGRRGHGIATALLEAAPDFARAHGARVLEGHPVDTSQGAKRTSAELYHGVASTFLTCGFTEIGRTSAARPVMRLQLG